MLSTAVASKAFGYIPIATELGSDDEMFKRLEEEQKKQQIMDKYNVTQEQMNQIVNQPMDLLAPINKRGGGMMNMDEMIKPIGMAGGGEFKDQLELEIIKLESTIKGLRADEVLTGTDNSRSIQGNQNLLEYYRSLR